jgi:hypothetical protein
MKMRQSIDKLNLQLEKNFKLREELEKNILAIQAKKETIQKICSHVNHVKLGQEPGSGKNMFKCSDCDYVGFYADFQQ